MSINKKIIAIQGYAGSYHEQVAHEYYGEEVIIKYCRSFREVLDSLRSGTVDEVIMAIANNRYGFITEPYALLMDDEGVTLQIIGEHTIRIEHSLLGIETSDNSTVTEIHSQSYAIGQCRKFIEINYPNAILVEQDDTALAAEYVKNTNNPEIACIASSVAGSKNNLKTIEKSVQDDVNNLTRFLILARTGEDSALDTNKSSILMQTSNSTGSLADCLLEFKNTGINISLLHSSFVNNSDFTMKFWLEFDAGWQESQTKELIRLLQNDHKAKIQLLGSYKK